jgi:hypothetical protein
MRSRLLFVVAQEPIFIEGRLFLLFVDRVEILLGESRGFIPCTDNGTPSGSYWGIRIVGRIGG